MGDIVDSINDSIFQFVEQSAQKFYTFGKSHIEILGQKMEYSGGILLETPSASPGSSFPRVGSSPPGLKTIVWSINWRESIRPNVW